MDTATDTVPVIEVPPVDTTPVDTSQTQQSGDIMIPLETLSFTTSSTSNIDNVLNTYFDIFPTSYFLLIIGFGIFSILIYTLYNYYLDQ